MACADAGDCGSHSTDLLDCPICYETFTNPRILPCLHTFCEDCLEKHIQNDSMQLWSQELGGSFACPTCRETIAIPHTGIVGFRKDFKVLKIKELLEKSFTNLQHESSSSKKSSKSQQCEFCVASGVKNGAARHCINCSKSLCANCVEKHKSHYLFCDHMIVLNNQAEENKSNVKCTCHKNEAVAYFCLKCSTAVCTLCTVTNHDGHSVTELSEGVKGLFGNLSVLQKSTARKLTFLEIELADIYTQENHLQYVYEQSCFAVKQRTEILLKQVKEREEQLLRDLELRYKQQKDENSSHKNELEVNVASFKSLTEFSASILGNEANVKMIDLYKELSIRMESLLQQSLPEKKNYTVQYNVFVPSETQAKVGKIKLAKVRTSSTSDGLPTQNNIKTASSSNSKIYKLVSQPNIQSLVTFGRNGVRPGEFNSPRDVCFLNDTTIVIADTNNDRLQVFEVNGSLVRVIGQGQIKPWGVDAFPDGNILVTDASDKCVKILSPEGSLIGKMGTFLCPCGVCVSPKGEIVVTDFFSNSVQILDRSGRKLRQFDFRTRMDQYNSGASRVACDSENRVIISDMSNKCVKVFNKQGRLVHKVDHLDELGSPQGVCVDSNDHIAITDLSNHQVTLHSPGGQYSHVILTKSQGMKDPTGVAMSSKGLLAVTQAKASVVKVFQVKSGSNTLLMRLPNKDDHSACDLSE